MLIVMASCLVCIDTVPSNQVIITVTNHDTASLCKNVVSIFGVSSIYAVCIMI